MTSCPRLCLQIVVEPLQDVIVGTEYADLTVRQGSKVQADLRLDPPKQHLYVMTEKKVSQWPLRRRARQTGELFSRVGGRDFQPVLAAQCSRH